MDPRPDHMTDLAAHLPGLLERAGVLSVQLARIERRHSFRGGAVSPDVQAITRQARREHQHHGFGFWEFALSAAVSADTGTRESLIDGALRHDTQDVVYSSMTVQDLERALRVADFDDLPSRTVVSLLSLVTTTHDGPHHLPMLDMGTAVSSSAQDMCVSAITALGLTGMLFESGTSYHFYGETPVDSGEFIALMSRAQLLAPIVDGRWAAHQLIDGHASLRISTDSTRHQTRPTLVATI